MRWKIVRLNRREDKERDFVNVQTTPCGRTADVQNLIFKTNVRQVEGLFLHVEGMFDKPSTSRRRPISVRHADKCRRGFTLFNFSVKQPMHFTRNSCISVFGNLSRRFEARLGSTHLHQLDANCNKLQHAILWLIITCNNCTYQR